MEKAPQNVRRSEEDRRTGSDRRQFINPQYNQPERRDCLERRVKDDRRLKTALDRLFIIT